MAWRRWRKLSYDPYNAMLDQSVDIDSTDIAGETNFAEIHIKRNQDRAVGLKIFVRALVISYTAKIGSNSNSSCLTLIPIGYLNYSLLTLAIYPQINQIPL